MKKKKRASKNRLLIFGSLSIFIIGLFIYTLFSYIIQVKNLKEEQIKLNNDLYALKEKESNLKNEIEKLKDPDYLARYARENYMYSKENEYIIKLDEKENEVSVSKNNKNYFKYLLLPILFIPIFIKIVKS